MNKKQLRSGDLLTSVVLIIVGLYFCIESYRITVQGLKGTVKQIYASAGFVPFIFGAVLIVLSIVVGINAVKEGGTLDFMRIGNLISVLKSSKGMNTVIILGLLFAYIFILIRILPYWLATFLFLFSFITIYYNKGLVKVIIISAITSATIAFLFGTVANIPLP